MFLAKDVTIYDELWDVEAASASTKKGDSKVVQDVFGFFVKDAEAALEEISFVYRMRQVESDKKVGTGEAILAGDRLYYYPPTDDVSPNKTGTYGTDYYFCGWAKKDAGALDEHVLMNFDGTRYNENL
jgi:hypothetical protein